MQQLNLFQQAQDMPLFQVAEEAEAVTVKLVGDFYEAYGENAVVVSKTLGFTLTSRPINGIRTPLCGIPLYSSLRYFQQLKDSGLTINVL